MEKYTFYIIYHAINKKLIYIGSTTNFPHRKREHKSDCYNYKRHNHNIPVYKFIRKHAIDWKTIVFEILDEFECDSLETARKFEQVFIDQFPNCLNVINAYTDIKEYRKEYYKNNKEQIAEIRKNYYENNKEQIAERKKKYSSEIIACDLCEKEMRRSSMSRHKREMHKA